MDGWKEYEGKNVFIILKNNRKYSGKIIDVDIRTSPQLIWITIIDKFNHRITFVHTEIEVIEEEVDNAARNN